MKDKKCKICGDSFTPDHPQNKYCSDICKKEAANNQKRKDYYKHRKERLKYQSEYNKAHSEEFKEYLKDYEQSERRKAYKRKYFQEHKEEFAERKRLSRAWNKIKEQAKRNSDEQAK